MSTTAYSISAKYYDGAYAAKSDLVDLPFYVDLARKIGGPVLEMGCGTGRALLPIARAGVVIHGLDNSEAMLDILRQHIAEEAVDVQQRIVLHQDDMRGFRGYSKYPLVTIPFRPMQHMYVVEDQIKALETARFHLQDDGILAFDVFFPKFELITANLGVEMPEMEWPDPSQPGRIVRRFFRKDSVDKVNQVFSFTFIYRTYEGNALVLEENESFQLGYYTYPHLRALFRVVGLEVVEEYGSFAKAPLDNNATDMIFLLKKSG
jgi:SAM-dependent methyltransferase